MKEEKGKKEREKVGCGRDKGEMGEIQGSREKKERKGKRTTRQGSIPKKEGKKREAGT